MKTSSELMGMIVTCKCDHSASERAVINICNSWAELTLCDVRETISNVGVGDRGMKAKAMLLN